MTLIDRFNLSQRLVDETDATFILELRTNPELSKYLSYTDSDLINQVEWIRQYKKRELEKREYYFITLNSQNERVGVNRLYNLNEFTFEAGSWLFKKDNGPIAILAEIATRDFGFSNLGYELCNFEVRKDNISVVNYHKRFRPTLLAEDESKYYFQITKEVFNDYKLKILKIYGYEFK